MTAPESSDDAHEALAALVRRGAYREALESCLVTLAQELGEFCQALLGDQAQAEQCLHDLLCTFRDEMPHLKARPIRSYLYARALSLCTQRLSARSRSQHDAMLAGLRGDKPRIPADAAEARDNPAAIRALLSLLKPVERDIALLHFLAGLDYGEVAEIVELPRDEVLKLAGRALLGLRHELLGAAMR